MALNKKSNGPADNPSAQGQEKQDVVTYIPQQQLRIKPLPQPFQREPTWPDEGLALLTDDGTRLPYLLADTLLKRGLQVVILCFPGIESVESHKPETSTIPTYTLKDCSEAAVGHAIQQVQQQGTIKLFIHLHPAARAKEAITQAVFWMAKHLAPILQQPSQKQAQWSCGFLAVTRLNGRFGYGALTEFDWKAGGLAGLLKSLNCEWPSVFCRAVDLHPSLTPEQAVDCLLTELLDTDLALAEAGYDAALYRATISTENSPASPTSLPPARYQPQDVVVVSGGARGITAQCIIALAKACPCTFLLLGRSNYQEEEPGWARGITEEKALKRTIFELLQKSQEKVRPIEIQEVYQQISASRSIKRTLNAIHQAGGKAVYLKADITDAAVIRQQLSSLQKSWGKITGIIHGAGALADKLVEKKTEADYKKVYGTKVQGLLNILDAVDASRLKSICLFSSIAGFYGNEGQTDYGLANDTLNKWAVSYKIQHPEVKVQAINWGPWKTGMVTPYIQQEYQKKGVLLIHESEGVDHFMDLLSQENGEVISIVNNKVPPPEKFFPLHNQVLRITKKVELEENPFLEHHVIGGYPVMPFVTGIAWIANAAEQLFPAYQLAQCKDSKLYNGIIFNGKQASDYNLDLEVLRQDKEGIRLAGKVWSLDQENRRRYHYGSEILLLPLFAEQPERQPGIELPDFPYQPLQTRQQLYTEGFLFHGPAYQGMEALWHMDEQELWYSCRLNEPDEHMQGQFPLQTSKTFTTDAMCQGFLVWAYHHLNASCLPAGMGSIKVHEPLPFAETFWVHMRITEQQGHKITGNATAFNAAGKVLVAAEDIALTVSRELLSLYKKQTDQKASHSLAVVEMDIQLPGILDLNAFHRGLYEGTLPAALASRKKVSLTSSRYHQMRRQLGQNKPLAVVTIGGQEVTAEEELQEEDSFLASTFSGALATAQNWLQQHPEGSIFLVAQDQDSGSEAIIRLMDIKEAKETNQSVYAVFSNAQAFNSAQLEPLMQSLNYLDVDKNISLHSLSLAKREGQEVPACALGTFIFPYWPLQELARMIKLSLCLHYGFIPALPERQNIKDLTSWDAQHFYAPETSFPWIPENKEEKRVAAMVFKEAESAVFLQLQEGETPFRKSVAYLQQQDRKLILLSGNDISELEEALEGLEREAGSFSHQWAAELYHRHKEKEKKRYTLSLVAGNQQQLLREISFARKGLITAFEQQKNWQTPNGSYFSAQPLGKRAKIAFLYPGLASSYVGMIKDSCQLFPDSFHYYNSKIAQLHELVHQPLVHPRYLQSPAAAERKAREAQFMNDTVAAAESSISMSVFLTHVLRKEFKLQPKGALGYSMGGISMFFAMEVWGFQQLSSRVRQSPVFQQAKRFEHWAHWVLNAPAEQVKKQLAPSENLYLSFINSPGNVIISGEQTAGEAWLRRHEYEGIMVDLHNVAHCPPVATMHEKLRQMHLMEIEKTPDVLFYSGPGREPLPLKTGVLAKNAADTYCQPVDFDAQVRKAYQDGFNVFIEVGPKAWCSRLVGDILRDEPHVSLSTNQKGVSDYRSLLQLCSVLCSHGIPAQLPFYENASPTLSPSALEAAPIGRKEDKQIEEVAEQQFISQGPLKPVRSSENLIPLEKAHSLVQALHQPSYLYQDPDAHYFLSGSNAHNSSYTAVGHLPALPPEKLGNPAFLAAHKVKFAYMAGAMANGIASEEMVIALGRQGFLGSFGAAGLSLQRVEKAIISIQEALPQGPYAFNLIHSLGDEALEMRLVELYLAYEVRTLEASAFMEISTALVYYKAAGLVKDKKGNINAQNKIIAKVSRSEVARLFMQPAPEALLKVLVLQEKISREQMEWAKAFPLADDITVEADSGGHTDNQPLVCALPEIIRLKERIEKQHSYPSPLRIGAAGGISTPASIVAAFALGADYVVTGSINQACTEAATSKEVKALLAKASSVDVVLAPSADMFEMGINVQVLKRGTMYANRAKKLYQLYSQYESLTALPPAEMEKLEKQLFQKSVAEVWSEVEQFFLQHEPLKLEAARQHPKKKMALVFRWYLGLSSKWAVKGEPGRAMDYQVWCGPSMGAFNDWVRESPMEAIENRQVAAVAARLLREAALLQRMHLLKMFGVPAAVAMKSFSENKMPVYE